MKNVIRNIVKILKKMYSKSLKSIAFYPILLGFIYILLACTILYIENLGWLSSIKEEVPHFFIEDKDTAKTILSTLITGVLSLTVFSFTMVMVVLNQASANFSPRLLPGLISDRKHQIILGTYIGTLLYCILILLSLGAYGSDQRSIGFSITLAAVLGILCVALFVYFIHTISQSIQIHNIIKTIYTTTKANLDNCIENVADSTVSLEHVISEDWNVLHIDESGYFREFDYSLLSDNLKQMNNQIEIIPYNGQHIWKGSPVLKSQSKLTEEEEEGLLFCVSVSSNYDVDHSILAGVRKLMEIAVRALSPGVNDPGTAIEVLSDLGQLLRKTLSMSDITSTLVDKGKLVVLEHVIPANELMRIIVQPIRSYAKQDLSVLHKLLETLNFLSRCSELSQDALNAIYEEIQAVQASIDRNISCKIDKHRIQELFQKQ